MAGNLLTSYGAQNFVLLDDYKMRFNSIKVGQPEVAVLLSGNVASVQTVTWKRGIMEESCRFSYIGMSYDAAQNCAASMRSLLTFWSPTWIYGDYLSGGNWLLGWHHGFETPKLESGITVQRHGSGCMYDVVVDARYTAEEYTTGGYAGAATSQLLRSTLAYIPGFNSSPPLSGTHFDTAGADNIVLVSAPQRRIDFELVGQDIYTTKKETSISGWSLTSGDWYRATIDSTCQVRYEGMTRSACQSLYNSLNRQDGWYLSSHPWELSAYFTPNTTQLNIGWVKNENVRSWQCLNDYTATEGDGGMFAAELTLHATEEDMTNNPHTYTPPSAWPGIWNKIPGLSAYL